MFTSVHTSHEKIGKIQINRYFCSVLLTTMPLKINSLNFLVSYTNLLPLIDLATNTATITPRQCMPIKPSYNATVNRVAKSAVFPTNWAIFKLGVHFQNAGCRSLFIIGLFWTSPRFLGQFFRLHVL